LQAFADISRAHLNPVVTLTDAFEHRLPWLDAAGYVAVQIVGGIVGAMTAHAMFGLPAISLSLHPRHGWPLVFSEFIATFGLC
jgi:glycerol uptake facilitator-like aquaporin